MKRLVASLLMTAGAVFADPIVDQAVANLNSYAQVQKNLKIQDPDLSYGMRKALVMADLLFDSNGHLLLDRCAPVKSAFIPAQPEDFEADMVKVIDSLNGDFWGPFFDSVTAPANNLVLEGLFSTRDVTDRHAKVAVLAALLAPYNQGPVGDCFAVSDVIRDHEEYYRNAANDYKSIIMHGYIERPVNGNVDHFFFLPVLADGDRDQPITLNFALFDAPGFAAARTVMGGDSISNLEQTIKQALGNGQVTPSQVIAAMAKTISTQSNRALASLQSVGEYAFSSLTNNPVLRAVEACFAAMAEDRPNDSTRGNINQALSQALQNVLSNQSLIDTFNASYRLVYNLNIPLAQPADDGSSTDGGFQLYKRTANADEMGTRIESPQDFRQLVLDALAAAKIQDQNVLSFINSDDFLKQVLWDYDSSNQNEPNPVQNYEKLSRTPMQSCDGDNPYEVDDIDTKTTYDNNVQTYTPSNAKDLITWAMTLAQKAPKELIPMNSPQHAFNFAPANPDLVAFVQSKMTPSQWLQKMLIVPGMQVATKQISPCVQQEVVQRLILAGLPGSDELKNLQQSLASQNLSVQTFAQKLLSGIESLYQVDPNQLALVLDSMLFKSLSPNDQAILQNSAIRFAMTNWNQGTKDIYFCAYFNPRTEQIGFGTIFEDKSNLSSMDESSWVNNQQWDVDLMPFAPQSKR